MITQAQVNALSAGPALNYLTSIAITIHRSLPAEWFTFPSLYSERLRRQLDLPQTNPLPNGYPTFAGQYDPDWSGSVSGEGDLSALITSLNLSYSDDDQSRPAKCKFIVTSAMQALGMT